MPLFSPAPVPPGPLADLFAYVQHCYLRAGQPSFRRLANGKKYSYTTVNGAIRGPRLPGWEVLEAIHKDLGADEDKLRDLWADARLAANKTSEADKIPIAERLSSAHRSAIDLLDVVRSIRIAPRFDLLSPVMISEQTQIHKGKINRIVFRPGSSSKATVGEDGSLKLWRRGDIRTPSLEIEAHDGSIYGAAFNRRGDLIATAGSDRLVKLWNTRDGSPAAAPLEHDRSVRDVAFGPMDDHLVSVSSDGTTRVWDPKTSSVVDRPFPRRKKPLLCVATSANGRVVAIGGADGVIELWDSQAGSPPLQLQAHTDQIKTLAFHPQQPCLASSGMDRTVTLWNTDTGKKIGSYDADHDGTLYSLAFSPDGSLLASGSYDGCVRVLTTADTSAGATVIAKTKGSVRSVAFSPDGTSIAAATSDGSILTCASARLTVDGSELEDVQSALERIADLTRAQP